LRAADDHAIGVIHFGRDGGECPPAPKLAPDGWCGFHSASSRWKAGRMAKAFAECRWYRMTRPVHRVRVDGVEANAINTKGEILAMGKMVHGTMPSQNKICAPAPPLSFMLTPIASP